MWIMTDILIMPWNIAWVDKVNKPYANIFILCFSSSFLTIARFIGMAAM
jgi:hypothetical protein